MESKLNDKIKYQLALAHKLRVVKAKNNFWTFCLYMDEDFFNKRRDILKPIAQDMQRLVKPQVPQVELDILNVSLPPRTGKSYLCTLFCTWTLGHFPTESIMRNTVTNTLYNKFSKDAKRIMLGNSHRGRYFDIFPNLEFETTNIEGWTLEQSEQGVSYYGNGIGGAIIGFGATKLSIIDDSVKGEEEALNINALDKKWRWYGSEVDSREEKGCKKLFIGTRWSKKDIVGRLKKEGFFNRSNAKEIVVPCIIDGKSYCEEIHTTEKLMDKKKITSDFIWEAEWMQNPVESKGLLFPSHSLKRFKLSEIQNRKPDGIIFFCDTADRGNDFLSCPIGYLFGDYCYIADVEFSREDVDTTEPEVVDLLMRNRAERGIVESNKDGRQFARNIRRLLKEEKYYCDIKERYESTNKETRILMQSGYIKEYFYFLESEEYELGSQYYDFMVNLTSYSKEGKNKNDDGPDSLAGLARELRNPSKPTKVKFYDAARLGL